MLPKEYQEMKIKVGDILRLYFSIEPNLIEKAIGWVNHDYLIQKTEKRIDLLIDKIRKELPKKGLKIRYIDVDRIKMEMVVEAEVVKLPQEIELGAVPVAVLTGIITLFTVIAGSIGLSLTLKRVEKIVEKPIPALGLLGVGFILLYILLRRK